MSPPPPTKPPSRPERPGEGVAVGPDPVDLQEVTDPTDALELSQGSGSAGGEEDRTPAVLKRAADEEGAPGVIPGFHLTRSMGLVWDREGSPPEAEALGETTTTLRRPPSSRLPPAHPDESAPIVTQRLSKRPPRRVRNTLAFQIARATLFPVVAVSLLLFLVTQVWLMAQQDYLQDTAAAHITEAAVLAGLASHRAQLESAARLIEARRIMAEERARSLASAAADLATDARSGGATIRSFSPAVIPEGAAWVQEGDVWKNWSAPTRYSGTGRSHARFRGLGPSMRDLLLSDTDAQRVHLWVPSERLHIAYPATAEEPDVRSHELRREVWWSQGNVSKSTWYPSEHTLFCVRAFAGADGSKAGVVALEYSSSAFSELMDGGLVDGAGWATVLDSDWAVLLEHGTGQADEGAFRAEQLSRLREQVETGGSPTLLLGPARPGRPPLPALWWASSSWSQFATGEASRPWQLVVELPEAGLLEARLRQGGLLERLLAETERLQEESDVLPFRFGIALVIGGLLLVCLVAWQVSRRLSRPLRKFEDDIMRMANDAHPQRIELQRQDEIGDLVATFNLAAEQFLRIRQSLEQKVSVRTRELQASAVELHESAAESRRLYSELAQTHAEIDSGYTRLEEAHRELAATHQSLERTHAELKQAQAELIHRDRLAVMGRFMAGIAHEINNPVNFIASALPPLQSNIERLDQVLSMYRDAEGLSGEEKAQRIGAIEEKSRELQVERLVQDTRRAFTLIKTGVERTTRIVSDLRSFSRSRRGELRQVDLARNVEITLSILGHELRNRVRVHRLFAEVPLVECNAGQINQVFMNLISNAAQAIEGDGDIWLSLRPIGQSVLFTLRDSGCGMPPEQLRKIFEPFYTTKGEEDGTGLGLSITNDIIRQHGGSIEVVSEVGAGTEFRVALPVEQPKRTADYDSIMPGQLDPEDDRRRQELLEQVRRELSRRMERGADEQLGSTTFSTSALVPTIEGPPAPEEATLDDEEVEKRLGAGPTMRSLPAITSPPVTPAPDIAVPVVSDAGEQEESREARARRREARRRRRKERLARARLGVTSDGSSPLAATSDTDDSMAQRNESDTLETLDAIMPPDEVFLRGGGDS